VPRSFSCVLIPPAAISGTSPLDLQVPERLDHILDHAIEVEARVVQFVDPGRTEVPPA